MKYNIQKKTPNGNWNTIHKDFDKDTADTFLFTMGQGGYDKSATDGSYTPDTMEASFYDGGDLIKFRAIPATN